MIFLTLNFLKFSLHLSSHLACEEKGHLQRLCEEKFVWKNVRKFPHIFSQFSLHHISSHFPPSFPYIKFPHIFLTFFLTFGMWGKWTFTTLVWGKICEENASVTCATCAIYSRSLYATSQRHDLWQWCNGKTIEALAGRRPTARLRCLRKLVFVWLSLLP